MVELAVTERAATLRAEGALLRGPIEGQTAKAG